MLNSDMKYMYIFVKMWTKESFQHPLITFIDVKDLAFTISPFYTRVQITWWDRLLCHSFSGVFWFWVVRAVYWLSKIIEHILLAPYLSLLLNTYQRTSDKVLRREFLFFSETFVLLKYHVFSNTMCCHYHHPPLNSFTKIVTRMVGKTLLNSKYFPYELNS